MTLWKLRNLIFRVVRPKYWIQNEPTDYEWDAILRDLMKKRELVVESEYHVFFGGVRVWVANFPYSFGNPAGEMDKTKVLPSPITRKQLKQKVDAARKGERRAFLESIREKINA